MNLFMLAQETTASSPWTLYWIAPVGAVVALIMAYVFSRGVMAQSEGEPEMIEIAEHVRSGAMAYLKRQYKVVFVVFVVLIGIIALLAYTQGGYLCGPLLAFQLLVSFRVCVVGSV